jgi:hypothetical protein
VSSSPRRLVLGLVIVVPRLACRPCPRRNGIDGLPDGDAEGEGEPLASDTAVSSASPVLLSVSAPALAGVPGVVGSATAGAAAEVSSVGVAGKGDEAPEEGTDEPEDMRALPSSDSASTSSGGRRSFSMSDLRLQWYVC